MFASLCRNFVCLLLREKFLDNSRRKRYQTDLLQNVVDGNILKKVVCKSRFGGVLRKLSTANNLIVCNSFLTDRQISVKLLCKIVNETFKFKLTTLLLSVGFSDNFSLVAKLPKMFFNYRNYKDFNLNNFCRALKI